MYILKLAYTEIKQELNMLHGKNTFNKNFLKFTKFTFYLDCRMSKEYSTS